MLARSYCDDAGFAAERYPSESADDLHAEVRSRGLRVYVSDWAEPVVGMGLALEERESAGVV